MIQDLKRMPFIIVFSVGAVLRAQVVLKSDFPINDGGMFFVMIKDLIVNGYKLPFFTTYNSSQIPFAYPPLAFYIAGFVHQLSGIEIVQLLRFIPLINSIITIPFFYLLSKNLYSRRVAVFATFVFAILPRSFEWQIMGGGLTRSFGLLFSIITLYLFSKRGGSGNFLLRSIFLSLTCLSHFEWFAFTVGTLLLMIIFKKVNVKKVAFSLLISTAFLLPWLILVTSRFGLQPFISFFMAGVSSKGSPIYTQILFFKITDEYFLTVFGVMTIIGLFIQIARKDLFLIFWLVAPLIITQRSAPNLTSVPISILSGIAILEIYLLIKDLNKSKTYIAGKAFLFVIFFYSILNTVSLIFIEYDYYYYDSLTESQRKDILSFSEKIPSNECVLVLTNKHGPAWGVDSVAEWFPALTNLKSPITAQGYEWLPDEAINNKINFYNETKSCFNTGLDCLENVEKEYKSECKFVYVEKPEPDSFSTALISKELNESEKYQLLSAGETAGLFERR